MDINEIPLQANDPVAVFIDGANTHTAAKVLGFNIDYRLLCEVLNAQFNIARLSYYTALMDDENERTPLRPLVDWLSYNGYNVVTKQAKVIRQKDGTVKIKGNMDIEMALDCIDAAQYAKHIILFTGDGDFCALLTWLQRRGIRVTVVSSIETQPSMIADELRKQADFFVDLMELRSRILNDHEN